MAEKMGGIRAIRELIDSASSSSEEKVIKFSSALGSALKSNTDFALTEQIADALGYMARVSPVANVDYVEIELIRSLDWLRGEIPYRRLAACVVLQQLAENAPTVFFGRAREFFDYIWGPLWDPREDIRVTAAKALCACLSVLRQRNYHLQWYYDVYEQIKVGIAKGTTECVHGSLLVAREVLRHTGNFMIPRFKEVCSAIFSMKDHKAIIVRVAIIKLIPELAIFCPDAFQRSYLDESVDILIKNVRSPQSELRTSSLLAIGQLCKSMGSALYHRIDELDLIIREILGGSAALQSSDKSMEPRLQSFKGEIPPEALLCVADMIRGLGTPFHSHVVGLLDAMLQSGLTQELIALCQVISTNLPGQKGQVQQRLLEEVMRVLGGASAESVFALIPPKHSLGWQARTPSVAPGKKTSGKAGAAMASQTPSRQSGAREPMTPEQSQTSGSKSIFKSLFSRGKGSQTIERNNAKESGAVLGTPSTPYYGLSGGALVYSFPGMGGPLGASGTGVGRGGASEYHTPSASSLASLCGNRPPELVVLSLQTLSTLASTQTGVGTHFHDVNDLPPYFDSDMRARHRHRGSDYASGEHNMASRIAMKQWVDHKDDVSSLGNMLIQLVPRIVVRLFYCDNVDVRREAIVTACKLISPYASLHRTRGPTASIVESTLRAIIEVAVVDPDPIVRTTALRSLPGSQFDRFLSQTHHLENLFLLLADDKYDIRLGALKVLGKLTYLNPSYLLANMRRMLLQLIVELRSGYDDRQKEEAALLLSDFMQIAPLQRLIKSFLPRLVVSLPLRCNEGIDIRLRTAGLEALGDLALVCRGLMLRFVDQLLPLVIVHVQDSSSKLKQEKAILALGKIASATGCVVKPYLVFPLLLPYLFQLLERGENSPWSLRREVLRTMGILGSLEPRKYGLILNHRLRCLGDELDEADVDADVEEMHHVGYYKTKAPSAAIESKRDPSGSVGSPDAKRATGASTPKSDKIGYQFDGISMAKTASFTEKEEKLGVIERSAEEVLTEAAQKALSDEYAGSVINPKVTPMAFDDLSEPVHQYLYETISIRVQSSSDNPDVQRLSPSNEDYYPKMAIGALMAVLRKPSLSVHHAAVIQAVMAIFKGLGAKCVQFLDQVIPYLLQIIHECGAGLRESLLQQFAQLAVIVKYNLGTYLSKMLGLVVDFWDEHTEHALVLAEEIAISAPSSISPFIPTFLPLLMGKLALSDGARNVEDILYEHGFVLNVADGAVCNADGSPFFAWQLQRIPAFRQLERALSCVDTLKNHLAPYVALVCPTLCRLESQLRRLGPVGCVWQMCALRTMHRLLCGNVTFTDAPPIAVRLLQTLTASISELAARRSEKGFDKLWERERNGTLSTAELSSDHEHDQYLRVMNEALATICSVGKRLGHQFLTFDRQIRSCLSVPGIVGLNVRLYEALTIYIKGRNIDTEYRMLQRALRSGDDYYQFNGVSAGIGHNSQLDAALNDSRLNMSSIHLGGSHGSEDIPAPFIDQQLSYYASVRTRKGSGTLFSGADGLDPDDTYTSGEGKATMNHLVLQRAWDVSQRSTAADWNEWIRRLKIELLRESPSLSLRSCSSLSQAYSALADELFHPAFVSCWLELGDTHRDSLIKALTKAISASSVSQEVIQKILNLAEFMEHDVEPLPISPAILAELAQRSRAYAKALHYRELEFQVSPAECFENLINVNKKLDMYDAAFGVLKVVKQMQVTRPDLGIEIKPGWLAKLGFWEEALARCDEILASDPNNCDAILGKIKSLDALGRWEDTVQLCLNSVGILKAWATRQQPSASQQQQQQHQQESDTPPGSAAVQSMKSRDIDNLSENAKGAPVGVQSPAAKDQSPIYARAAVVGARAAWALGEWDVMDSLVSELPESGLDTSFLKAVLAVHQEDFPGSSLYIDRTRRHLDDGIAALMEESYSRAYVHLVMVQQLSELEEIVEYKQVIRDAGFMDRKGGCGTPLPSVPTLGNRFPSNPALFAIGAGLTPNQPSFMGSTGNPALVGSPKVTPLTPYGVPKTIMSPSSRSKSGILGAMTSADGGFMTSGSVEEGVVDEQGNQLSRHQTESLMELQDRKQFMREKWRKKMTAGKSTGRSAIPYWQRLMNIHHMVLCEREDLNTSLDFAMLSRKARNFHLSDRILNAVQGCTSKAQSRPITTSSSVGNIGTLSLNDLSASAQSGLSRIGSEPVLGVSRSLISREINPAHNFPASANFAHGGRNAMAESPSRLNRPGSFGHGLDQSQDPETLVADRKIRFAVLRQAWAKGNHEFAIAELTILLDQIRSENRTQFSTLPPNESNTSSRSAPLYVSTKNTDSVVNFAGEMSKLHLECLMKLGSWRLSVLGPAAVIDINTRQRVLELYREATSVDNKSYSAWHNWGLSNFRAIQESEKTNKSKTKSRRMSAGGGFRRLSSAIVIPDTQIVFIVSAVKGLMHAISLGTRKWTASVLQDMLYVLTIWFQFGHVPIVAASIEAGLSTMHLDTWLGVVPQLIARIDHNEDIPRHLLHNLLGRLGAKHPQALVYPLFVALKAPSEMRREAAKAQLNLLRQHSGTLIDQALLVTEELNRIAILWPEHWHETLEDASKQYFGEGNIVGMLETLAPVHELLERGPTTLHEASFCQSFGNELLEAGECLKRYVRLMNETGKEIPRSGAAPVANPRKQRSQMSQEDLCLVQAWDLYYAVFKRITADLPQEMKLDLPQVSPSLVSCTDMNLAVPGSYTVNGSAVRIQKFGHVVHIIRSKQRPRKIRIIGEDGNEYVFLLKVNEDISMIQV
jgi:tetratricopeptide (TPR) repeat protein